MMSPLYWSDSTPPKVTSPVLELDETYGTSAEWRHWSKSVYDILRGRWKGAQPTEPDDSLRDLALRSERIDDGRYKVRRKGAVRQPVKSQCLSSVPREVCSRSEAHALDARIGAQRGSQSEHTIKSVEPSLLRGNSDTLLSSGKDISVIANERDRIDILFATEASNAVVHADQIASLDR